MGALLPTIMKKRNLQSLDILVLQENINSEFERWTRIFYNASVSSVIEF